MPSPTRAWRAACAAKCDCATTPSSAPARSERAMEATSIRRQRGAAALITTLMLFFVMTLVAAFANRNHIFEQRASANQVRATQALEAADAGAEWAIAMLNSTQPIDDRCIATNADGARSLR